MNNEAPQGSSQDYQVTVTAPATTDEFIQFLRDSHFNGNVSTNPNYPGVVWLGPNPNG